jgi:hypothetical protein
MPKESNKQKVLIALIETPSIREAAQVSGISEATIYNYLRDPEFKNEYRSARRATVENAVSQMQNAMSEAVGRLKELMFCENPAVAARCAQIIYENSLKGLEILDLNERLEILENAVNTEDKKNGKSNNKRRF